MTSTITAEEKWPEKWPEYWGTDVMGPQSSPSAHPQNKKAATWVASDHNTYLYQIEYTPLQKPSNSSPIETVLDTFNEWGKKAESLANKIWQHLKIAPSVSEVALGKLSLTAKAIAEGGFEGLYKRTFPTDPSEKLLETFACYLSTSTGPVAGTLFVSNLSIAFCSDRPLWFIAPSGEKVWSYYKIFMPLAKITAINSVKMKQNPSEKYIRIVTIDGRAFWFMGFVNYEKAVAYLSEALSNFSASKQTSEPILA